VGKAEREGEMGGSRMWVCVVRESMCVEFGVGFPPKAQRRIKGGKTCCPAFKCENDLTVSTREQRSLSLLGFTGTLSSDAINHG
jgi:hypothetical protein